jgi:hypothetical protein
MSMTYTECKALIRDRLQAPDTLTLDDAAIGRTFDAAYRQWRRLFCDRITGLTGAQTCSMAAGGFRSAVADTAIYGIETVYACNISGVVPGNMAGATYNFALDRITSDEMRFLLNQDAQAISPAAGFPAGAGNATPSAYAVEWDDTSAAWILMVYPKCLATTYFPMNARKYPAQMPSVSGIVTDAIDDEVVGLCAVTSIRLMPTVGKQNDSGLMSALASEVPQQMQQMILAPKAEEV